MSRPEFTEETQQWLAEQIDYWYYHWKDLVVDVGTPHRLGVAKEQLKDMICGVTSE